MSSAQVYLIDDDEAIRDSLSFLLQTQSLNVRAFASPARFLEAAPDLAPGCIVTDMRMPDMTGLQLVRKLDAAGVRLPVIVITGHGDVPLAVEAMKAGVVDFIEKPFSDNVILSSIRSALARLEGMEEKDAAHADANRRIAKLTKREREVLGALVAGRANKVIADELGISARTVEVYRANVMTKMQAGSLSELVRQAIASGLF